MQRRKTSANVEVKQVIGALCKVLSATGLDSVPAPDTFRRAKFGGGPEVEDQFWRLLFKILQRTGLENLGGSTQPRACDHRKLASEGLLLTGYHADWMCGREAGEEERRSVSSTDLLLALGWLLASGALEKLLINGVQRLDKTLLTTPPVNTRFSPDLRLDLTSLRRLQWLVGALRHQRRILLSMTEERSCLLHDVFSASLPSVESASSSHCSTALKEDCINMGKLCDLLDAYLNWKHVETVFWSWMDSVMDKHPTGLVVKASGRTPSVYHHRNQALHKSDESLSRPPPSETYRARLQVEGPVRVHTSSAQGCHDGEQAADVVPSSLAAQLLLQTEAQLLEKKDRQRLVNRMQLQETIGQLEGLVLIPP